MLIQRAPDVYEKLRHLGGMATDDVLSPAERSDGMARPGEGWERVGPRGGVTPHAGVYRAAMPNGKRISLMRVMFTDHCIMDCHYCPNSYWVPRRRYGFKVDELARLFDEMHSRHMVEGLFLSSGIFKDPNATQERLLDTVEAIRSRYGFRGYVHLKVMPGTSTDALLEQSQRLGARLSVNMESPSAEHLRKVSTMKDFDKGIVAPMKRISELMQERYGGAVGQATQLVVGAADESDWDIYTRMRSLYGEYGFKRVYYSAFRPVQVHAAGGAPRDAARARTPPLPDGLAVAHLWLRHGGAPPRLRYGRLPGVARRSEADDRSEQLRAVPRGREPRERARAAARSRCRAAGCEPHREAAGAAHHHSAAGVAGDGRGAEARHAIPALPRPQARPREAGRTGALPLSRHSREGGNPAAPSSRRTVELHAAHAASGCASCPLNPGTCGMAA